ncbi:MAG: T9SS type A sorting domain-containing protein [Flavobacteriales bacterium]|jgi:protocatechuate 3,4-dioxygenase beta subunit|nr:T9SS type A sorting domain-containing protein [Flavobacteriales bacterium]
MEKKKKDSRRQFLRNTSLAALSFGILPVIAKTTASIKLKSPILCDESTEDAYGQGPFYTANAPSIQNNMLADSNEIGTRLILSGQVYNLECSEVIPNTEIDIWHANDDGDYDNSGYNLRGKTTTNSQGFYVFETIKPGLYLNGATYRPSHFHFKITPPNFPTLITQLYFAGDPYIASDAAASITSGIYDATNRIIPLTTNSNGDLEGSWDIVINGDGVSVGASNIHLDKGIIYSASPNPFNDRVEIKYGVFLQAKVSVFVYDIHGRIVAQLDEQQLSPEKYNITWEADSKLPNGHYFIALKINELQVHYLKVIKQ